MVWTQIAATGLSALSQGLGASGARRRQEEAMRQANAVLQAAQARGETLQLPYANAGSDAIQQLMAQLPSLTQAYDPARLLNEPGYKFGRDEGQRALEGSLAAKGLTDSGAALKAAARYGANYSTSKLGEAFDRDRASRGDIFDMLTGVSGIGQRSAESISGLGERTAQGVAGNIVGAGNVGAAARLAQGNVLGDLLNYGASKFPTDSARAALSQTRFGSSGFGTGLAYGNEDLGLYLADGGAVPRRARRVMSREAVLQALDEAWSAATPAGPPPVIDPTEGQSFGENALAGVGRGMASLVRAAGGKRLLESLNLPGTAEEADSIDAPLLRTAGGTVGNAIGRALPAAVAAPFVPLPASAALAMAPGVAEAHLGQQRDRRRRDEMVRDYSSGGAVRGKSGGKADKIVAHLSGGEHVLDAEVVSMLGDGNSEAGHALLEDLKRRVREFKRRTADDRTAPAVR